MSEGTETRHSMHAPAVLKRVWQTVLQEHSALKKKKKKHVEIKL